jgi:hypothetical protein
MLSTGYWKQKKFGTFSLGENLSTDPYLAYPSDNDHKKLKNSYHVLSKGWKKSRYLYERPYKQDARYPSSQVFLAQYIRHNLYGILHICLQLNTWRFKQT